VRTKRPEQRLAGVPFAARHAGEADRRWRWVEPTVWSPRMLTALEKGVKGGRWFSLIAGRTASSPLVGCSLWSRPTRRSVNPL